MLGYPLPHPPLTDSGVHGLEAKVGATAVGFELSHQHARYEDRLISCDAVACVLANEAGVT